MRIPQRPTRNLLRVRCPWCKAAVGVHCTVRHTRRILRDANGHSISHHAREDAFRQFEADMQAMAREVFGGESP